MLENAPMQYAPQNELGVVFLFAHVAKRLRLKVETIRPQYPNCIAYQKTGRGEKPVRIEFEYRSRNFRAHRHKVKHCDWLVCWSTKLMAPTHTKTNATMTAIEARRRRRRVPGTSGAPSRCQYHAIATITALAAGIVIAG